jgi:methionine-rich copper-binding protein CopC
MMRWRAVMAATFAALIFVSGVPSAWGHASQVSSTPAAGESVPVLPTEIVIAFDSTVMKAGLAVVVRDPSGAIVGGAQPTVVQNEVRVGLSADEDASGTFAVAYRVVSEDGHAITGQFDFTVVGDDNPNSGTVPAEPTSAANTPGPAVVQDAGESSTGAPMIPIILSLLVLATIGVVLALRWRGGN